ncbi:MAG: hypothetical protein ACOX0X_03000 [Candidatus Dojkabacteria bacterium]|jgi:hypothetical protein
MKKRWNVNWLVIITVCLLLSALSLFYASFENSLGFTKCAYGDIVYNGDKSCMCDSKGKLICDEDVDFMVESADFTTENLGFTYGFQNLITNQESPSQTVRFVNISQVGNILRVVVEKSTLCNEDNLVAPHVGFYKYEKDKITFTIGENFVDTSFNIPCMSESLFEIRDMSVKFSDDFKIYFQDQLGTLTPARNCSYEGFLKNEGDVYNSSDGCFICTCKLGQNSCEKEKRCLK